MLKLIPLLYFFVLSFCQDKYCFSLLASIVEPLREDPI